MGREPGMKYQDVLGKLKKYKSVENNPSLKQSLANQVKLRDGEDAAKAVVAEADASKVKQSCSTNFIEGHSMKILGGVGEGKCKPSFGRKMRHVDGKWVEVD